MKHPFLSQSWVTFGQGVVLFMQTYLICFFLYDHYMIFFYAIMICGLSRKSPIFNFSLCLLVIWVSYFWVTFGQGATFVRPYCITCQSYVVSISLERPWICTQNVMCLGCWWGCRICYDYTGPAQEWQSRLQWIHVKTLFLDVLLFFFLRTCFYPMARLCFFTPQSPV